MKILLATRNRGKLLELQTLLRDLDIQLIGLDEVPVRGEPEEIGETFSENAHIKAAYYARAAGLPVIADDSGISVEALSGAPGVYSARYAGKKARDAANNQKLLQAMQGVTDRRARFICAIVLVMPDGKFIEAEGVCEGEILEEMRGVKGFGYDPLFYVPEYQATFAEIDADSKNKISHRGRAIRRLKDLLPAFLASAE